MCSREEVKQEVEASEKRVLLKIDTMFSDFRKEIEDNVCVRYNQAISEVHKTAPETKKKLDAIELSLADHVSKEEKYWEKIDAMHEFMKENRDLIEEQNKTLNKMSFAIFGDKQLEEKGILKKNNEMYTQIIENRGAKKWIDFVKKYIIWGILGGIAVYDWIRR